MAPAFAIPRLLARHGLTYDDIHLWEIHEAFAAQVLFHLKALRGPGVPARQGQASQRDFGAFPAERMNPNGGSIALGHPFGATGARILSQAVKELAAMAAGQPRHRQHLRRRRPGQCLVIGGGMMSIDFLITTLIIVVSPGIGVLYTIATGLSRGARASVVAAFGCTLGIVPHMAAAIMGLAALLHTSAIAFQTMKYLGVAYLLYMAWMTLKEHGALKVENQVDQKSATQVIVHAILINILNPKLSIFFFAFLPQFVSADEAEPVLRMSELQRRVHADDLRGVRGLRPVRRGGAPARDLAAGRDDLDAPGLRRGFCRAGRQAGAGGSMMGNSTTTTTSPEERAAGRVSKGPQTPRCSPTTGPFSSSALSSSFFMT